MISPIQTDSIKFHFPAEPLTGSSFIEFEKPQNEHVRRKLEFEFVKTFSHFHKAQLISFDSLCI